MKKIAITLILLAFLIGFIPQSTAQTGNKSLGTGRIVFLCGGSSQQIMDQMMPSIPVSVTKDNFNFIYVNYNINGVKFTFQFYNDRLQGLMIWR